MERAVRLLAREGLEPYVYFIYALPGETPESARRTVEFMERLWRLGAVKITAYRFRPLPATAFESVRTEVSRHSAEVRDAAARINERSKMLMVGRTVRAVVAGVHPVRRALVAYPLPHGPVALVRGPRSLVGWLVELRIVDVVDDRMVEGVVVRRLRRVAPERPPAASSSGRLSPAA